MSKISSKRYACSRCGHVVEQTTNHYGQTWSVGRFNTCPQCPPWAKYGEYGGQTVWNCLESPAVAQDGQQTDDNPPGYQRIAGEHYS